MAASIAAMPLAATRPLAAARSASSKPAPLPAAVRRGALAAPCRRSSATPTCRAAETGVETDGAFMFVDAEAAAAELQQPLPKEEMIARAKEFLRVSVLDTPNLGALMADDFRFVAPVVGPLSKEQFLAAFGGFNILEAFPDLNPRYHHFRIDPYEAGRVWFTTTAVGTHTGNLAGSIPATGIEVRSPPQTCSVILDKDGLVAKYTIGYVNDKELGNTGGLGGIFGIFYAVGSPLPFPEANPWKKSKRYAFFQWIGKVTSGLNKKD